MTTSRLVLSHRQLVSAVISLAMADDPRVQPLLSDLGYRLTALELPMQDSRGRRFVPDLHLVNDTINLSLLVDCKCSPETLNQQQLESYLSTSGVDVVRQARLSVADARGHRVDGVFVALEDAEPIVASLLQGIINAESRQASGLGLIRVVPSRFEIAHDELSDPAFSGSIANGWNIAIEQLPLERLPYESSSPDWEVAQAVLQALAAFFIEGRGVFGVDDICEASNELWPFLADQHDHIRNRVRRMVRNLRRTALAGWLVKSPGSTEREDRWRFAKRPTTRANVQIALGRRSARYVELLAAGTPPRSEDFADVDQLPIPFVFPEETV